MLAATRVRPGAPAGPQTAMIRPFAALRVPAAGSPDGRGPCPTAVTATDEAPSDAAGSGRRPGPLSCATAAEIRAARAAASTARASAATPMVRSLAVSPGLSVRAMTTTPTADSRSTSEAVSSSLPVATTAARASPLWQAASSSASSPQRRTTETGPCSRSSPPTRSSRESPTVTTGILIARHRPDSTRPRFWLCWPGLPATSASGHPGRAPSPPWTGRTPGRYCPR